MRIKTMKRNCTNVLKKAQEAKQSAVSQNNLSLNVLVRAMKDRAMNCSSFAGLESLTLKYLVALSGSTHCR